MEIMLLSTWRPSTILNLGILQFWSRELYRHVILPYLTLPYQYGEYVLPPSAKASNGPNAHPRINRKVTKSPSAVLTSVHTNTWNHPPPKRGLTHLNLLTNMHSWYLQDNISSKAHKHIYPGHHDQQDSKPGNQGAF